MLLAFLHVSVESLLVRGERAQDIEVRRERADESPGRELLAAMLAELETIFGEPLHPGRTPSATAQDFDASRGGAFVVLYEAGRAIACGGLKRLEPDVGEIKRMYVVPAARSRGVARRLLGALEDAARARGYARVRLDTGPQEHARALYDSAGYRRIADYNGNRYAAYWFEKAL